MTTSTKTILIADPDRGNRERLIRSLRSNLFQFQEASRGRDLVDMVPKNVAMVIVSQELADMSAIDTLETVIRENPYFGEIPFLICASDNSATFFSRCIEKGFKGVFHKPFNRKSIFALVKKTLLNEGVFRDEDFADAEILAIGEREKIDFLTYLFNEDPPNLKPEYNSSVSNAYFYPRVTQFFAVDPGEGYDILKTFVEDGILERALFDKINLCPKCSWHTINFKEVCPHCGSLHIHVEEVYHHFSCGYVGPSSDFKKMTCPKCAQTLRHIGLDYEKPTDTYVCQDCRFVFTETKVKFNCFHCGFIGDADQAVITKVYTYSPTVKARKAVEYDSLSVFDFKKLASNEEIGCYTVDFFKFMLLREYEESVAFGDPLALMVVRMEFLDEVVKMTELLEFINSLGTGMDLLTIIGEINLACLTRRITPDELRKRAEQCRKFILKYVPNEAGEGDVHDGREPGGGAVVAGRENAKVGESTTSAGTPPAAGRPLSDKFGVFIHTYQDEDQDSISNFLDETMALVESKTLNNQVEIMNE